MLPVANLRVHVLSAPNIPAVDAASIYTTTLLDEFMATVNTIFEPVGLRWEVVNVVMEAAPNEQAIIDALSGSQMDVATALERNVRPGGLLAPMGWDMYIVRDLPALSAGSLGVYRCSVDSANNAPGVVFVSLEENGQPGQHRVWAHELGHMMTLGHTVCAPDVLDNLMTQNSCQGRDPDRVALTAEQITCIRTQFRAGGPAACGVDCP